MAKQNKNINKKITVPFLAFRMVLGIVIFGYITLGLAGIVGGDVALNAVNIFYGALFDLTPQVIYLVKIIGAFMLGVGILGVMVWNDPIRNRAITNGIIILLLLRVVEKIVFFNDAQQAFGISSFRLISGAALLFVLAALLYFLKPKQ